MNLNKMNFEITLSDMVYEKKIALVESKKKQHAFSSTILSKSENVSFILTFRLFRISRCTGCEEKRDFHRSC